MPCAMRAKRTLVLFVVVLTVTAAICALAGAAYALFHGKISYAHAIAWAMWIGGGALVLFVGASGSTSRMSGESRIVVGGRFAPGSGNPQPQSPFMLIPVGVLIIALGALIYSAA